MQLPGGTIVDGKRRRGFRFKALTGALELNLSESIAGEDNTPAKVTAVLCWALADLGMTAVSRELVAELSVGDRQFLLHQLAAHIEDAPVWLTANCGRCGELFDVAFRHSEIPVKRAGPDFPETEVETSQGRLRVRVPNGADQETISDIESETDALPILLQRLISSVSSPDFDVSKLADDDIDKIESAVEAMSPEVAGSLLTTCPGCSRDNRVPVSPYGCLARPVGNLFAEVHSLATHYHWAEREILEMPRVRRQTYLRLIDTGRGMHGRALA